MAWGFRQLFTLGLPLHQDAIACAEREAEWGDFIIVVDKWRGGIKKDAEQEQRYVLTLLIFQGSVGKSVLANQWGCWTQEFQNPQAVESAQGKGGCKAEWDERILGAQQRWWGVELRWFLLLSWHYDSRNGTEPPEPHHATCLIVSQQVELGSSPLSDSLKAWRSNWVSWISVTICSKEK